MQELLYLAKLRLRSPAISFDSVAAEADGEDMVADSVLDFLPLTIIVYHRDDRQKLFRRLFMQIESEVKCKYLLSCSREWICQSFYLP